MKRDRELERVEEERKRDARNELEAKKMRERRLWSKVCKGLQVNVKECRVQR
jgi:hypothetical protein